MAGLKISSQALALALALAALGACVTQPLTCNDASEQEPCCREHVYDPYCGGGGVAAPPPPPPPLSCCDADNRRCCIDFPTDECCEPLPPYPDHCCDSGNIPDCCEHGPRSAIDECCSVHSDDIFTCFQGEHNRVPLTNCCRYSRRG